LHWKKTFNIPREARLSASATDLLRKLIADPGERLGRNGAEEIKNHPFFYGVNWDNVLNTTAPNPPQISSPTDTCNFDQFEETEPFHPP
jgi:protein-serine/threonine kinase